MVSQSCNPSHSGGSDQEDRGTKPACANSSQDPISTNKLGVVALPVTPALRKAEAGPPQSRLALGKTARPYLKNNPKAKMCAGISQVLERLSGKQEALSSNSTTTSK
jgi:hypothetical protein